MKITDVRIKLASPRDGATLLAFVSIVFDGSFVLNDLKIIESRKGRFIAMPARRRMAKCPACSDKNHLRANHCNRCGGNLYPVIDRRDDDPERALLYSDIGHPITQECRSSIEKAAFAAYESELELSRLPGYACRFGDDRNHI